MLLYAARTFIPRENLKILMLGDGPGNDLLFLANNGLHVDYYEVPGQQNIQLRCKTISELRVLGTKYPPHP